MLFYILKPILTYNWILIVAAVFPALYLLVKVYQSDRLEKENKTLILRLVIGGILATVAAGILESAGGALISAVCGQDTILYNVLMYFGVVAFAEEGAKYFFLKRRSWRSEEFNCQYDGVVYSVAVALGFALFENIFYVVLNGFSTALVRAVTAVPGHACFGVFMGVFYGIAKRYSYQGNEPASAHYRRLSVIVPAFLHGAYDYIATMQNEARGVYFLVFIVILFVFSIKQVKKTSSEDRYIDAG